MPQNPNITIPQEPSPSNLPKARSPSDPITGLIDIALSVVESKKNKKQLEEFKNFKSKTFNQDVAIIPNSGNKEKPFLTLWFDEDGNVSDRKTITEDDARVLFDKFNAVPARPGDIQELSKGSKTFRKVRQQFWERMIDERDLKEPSFEAGADNLMFDSQNG